VTLLLLLAGCAAPGSIGTGTSGGGAGSSASGSAAEQLASLTVKGRAPMTDYDRDRFGPSWLDTDRNGCDTRNDMLARDLTHDEFEPGTHHCVVVAGDLADPYTATTIDFVKGDGNLVDIDHVVALGNAWATGAFRWEIRKRAALANDPMNLLAVDASANRQKGDGDAATWLPANKSFRCAYVARQIAVKAKYRLWVTPPEKAAMSRILGGCPDQAAVERSDAPVRAPVDVREPDDGSSAGSSPEPDADPESGGGGTADTSFANCTEARDAGAAPVHRGDPGYGTHLDRDGDGTACE
jgi:hypothetical protein